jgi:ketosteroid isomerase-like protein
MSEVDTGVRELFEAMYREFNARDTDALLDRMTEDVAWPNGWEGGHLHGRPAVRDYWTRQWTEIDPTVTPVHVAALADGRVDVTVDQTVRDRAGALMSQATVHHVYRFEDDRIAEMEIVDSA